jgi:hypothetical protein
MEVTNDRADMGRFRPPTLRNIALTAPYMHDGSMDTLEDVVSFYERGGRLIEQGINAGDGRLSPLKNGLVSGFKLTDAERQDLIAFLTSLTDPSFVTNPRFSDPFAAPAAPATPAAPAVLPGIGTPTVLSKAEYRSALSALIEVELPAMERELKTGNLPAAAVAAQRLHDSLHALHASSWQFGVGEAHNALEATIHRTLVTPLSSPNAYPPALVQAIRDMRPQIVALRDGT